MKLERILLDWPNNGFALVHYGFVLKLEGKLETAVGFLQRGIGSGENGTRESRFYFHLGDALQRLGREQEAEKVSRKIPNERDLLASHLYRKFDQRRYSKKELAMACSYRDIKGRCIM